MAGERILVVRMSSMGDVIHALPSVAALRAAKPDAFIGWVIAPRWTPLLEGNSDVNEVIEFGRQWREEFFPLRRRLKSLSFDAAVDFQGLVQSSVVARLSGARRIYGFDRTQAREPAAAMLYTDRVATSATHVVDMNREIATAAGASPEFHGFRLPPGVHEGDPPEADFVLISPEGGWGAKQWPIEEYCELVRLIQTEAGLAVVANGVPGNDLVPQVTGAIPHYSSIRGLIDITRRATAVVGIDSGPMHMAAALNKPGVAIFGPTDPARNGPYGDSFTVLRSESAVTSYAHVAEQAPSMRQIPARDVFQALMKRIEEARG